MFIGICAFIVLKLVLVNPYIAHALLIRSIIFFYLSPFYKKVLVKK